MIELAHRADPRFYVHWTVNAASALYVNVENPHGSAEPALRTLVEHAIVQHALAPGAPQAIAADIQRGLIASAGDPSLPGWVFYSAVLVSATEVETCLAGPHRVHLVQAGKLIASAREHILRFDQPPPDWPPAALASIDLNLQGDIVTRSLGTSASLDPETSVWATQAPYRVVVCSADAHAEREPSSYAAQLDHTSDLAAWSGHGGAVAVIQYP